MARTPLIVAGIVFWLVALVHILRLNYHWEVVIAGYNIPMYWSIVGLIVTVLLGIWMFVAASRTR
jgi:hypothetical protein